MYQNIGLQLQMFSMNEHRNLIFIFYFLSGKWNAKTTILTVIVSHSYQNTIHNKCSILYSLETDQYIFMAGNIVRL